LLEDLMMRIPLLLIALAAPAWAQPTAEVRSESTPWRLDRALGAPSWLRLGLEQQSRFEHLADDFRGMATDDATALSMRTLASAEASTDTWFGGLELEDSRIYASDATMLNTTLVDPLEVLQAYVGVRAKNLLADQDRFEARAGRITIDLSTRRVVARNRFRNTINGFTGVDAKWTSPRKHVARAFVAVPVTRLPGDPDALADNAIELDEESTDALLTCGYYGSPVLGLASQVELYAIGFHERDGDVASRNRRLITFGARWFKQPARGTMDFEIEVIPQVGSARATTAADDSADLDHRALTTHAELGVSPAMPWKPRLAVMHDYASGDRDPQDGSSERFDLLFGARRFDFGPTGIYGPFNRSNIQSPGARISIAPTSSFDAFVGYRMFWLASRSDAWVAANVRDPMGDSGSFIGEHVEIQLRWSPLPKNLTLEGGAAYLRRGRFARTAPDTRTADPVYVYTQVTVNL
jgi:hypothetical protein